jgi:hypothetical protein
VSSSHVLDERLDLPQRESVGGVPERAGQRRRGPQRKTPLADHPRHAPDRGCVLLGEHHVIGLGVRQPQRLPVQADEVERCVDPLREVTQRQRARSAEQHVIELGERRGGRACGSRRGVAGRRRGGGIRGSRHIWRVVHVARM